MGTADRIKLSATADEFTVNDFLHQCDSSSPRMNTGEYRVAGKLHANDPRWWYLELGPRSGDGDATVPITVADGTHSGGPYHSITFGNLQHADMLMDISVTWRILKSIDARLGDLIMNFERSLRQQT